MLAGAANGRWACWDKSVIFFLFLYQLEKTLLQTMLAIYGKDCMSLCPESSKNIPILLQEAGLCFLNQNDPMNPKMGSKQSVTGPTLWCFFQITFFGTKTHQKIGMVSLLIHSPTISTPYIIIQIFFSDISPT